MYRGFLWVGFIVYFLLLPVKSFAQSVVINEIFANPENEDDEFVELYNISDEERDISSWEVSDLAKSYIIPEGKISGKGFFLLEKNLTGIALNNSSETITIKDNSGNIIQEFSYEETIEEKSWARVPDGTGEFVNNSSPTKLSANLHPPTNTPKPTYTPKPIATPKPTKKITPMRSPTQINTIDTSRLATGKPSLTKKPSRVSTSSSIAQNVQGVSRTDKKEDMVEIPQDKTSPAYLYSLITGFGMLILACAILLFRKFKRNDEEDF